MFSKNKTSTARFYSDPLKVEELYTGYLHKSPALSGFTKGMKAWRRRFFVLSKIGDEIYQLTYYKNEEKRDKALGEINISRVGLICTCPEKHPMWDWIQKNFRCPPSSVLLLRVNDFMPKSARDYFLIGENSEDVNGWEKELVKVIRAQTENDESLQQDNRDRAKSEPTPRSEHYDELLDNRYAKTKSQGYAKPDQTDSRPTRNSEPIYTTQTKKENHYAVPRSYIAAKSPNKIPDSDDDEDDDEEEKPETPEDNTGQYMCMASIHMALKQTQEEEDTCRHTNTTTNVVETSRCLANATESQDKDTPMKRNSSELRCSKETFSNFNGNCAYTEMNKSERHTPVEKEICINRDDLNKSLIFAQEQGKLCVSDCKQIETSRLFHKGDQILAFNDLKTDTVEEIQTYLRRASKDEVKLTILRHPRSQPFHFLFNPNHI